MIIVKKPFALIILLGTLLIGLAACDLDVSTLPSQREVESLDVMESSIQNAYVIDDFDLSTIFLEVEETGGDQRNVALKDDYLDEASLNALESTGEHTLQGEYKDHPFSFEVRLLESSRDLLLHTVYRLGVEDADLEEDYETWLDSIHGVSVTDATVNDDGVLILTLSDESTIEAGLVKGDDGVDGNGIESIHKENGDQLVFTYDDGSEDSVTLDLDANKVAFKTDDETLIDIQHVQDGGSFTYPDAPERKGYEFDGWSEDSSTEVNDDLIVYAEYTEKTYELTFETDNDQGTITNTYAYGETIEYPSLSEIGREFIGWYLDDAFTSFFAEKTMPAEDLTLYARWIEEDTSSINIADMADSVRGSMVTVININEENGTSGSGVIYKKNDDDSYYVFTNHHVVDGHDSLEIEYNYNRNQYTASGSDVEFIGSYSEADVAVIRFTPETDHSVDTVDFADSYDLRTGETVYAYG
ncbi:MAG: InlB B-repeat-containing protein, partial [Bacillota bacterium]